MKITVFTECQQGNKHLPAAQSPSFYIQTGSYHCLFVSGTLNRLLKNADHCGINLKKTDRIVITERCPGLIQELQYFLLQNNSVTFYLPRITYQNYFGNLLYKLKDYSPNGRYPEWLSHIRFTDTLTRVDEHSWLYSLPDKGNAAAPPKQVLVIREDSLSCLFVNADSSNAEIRTICQAFQKAAGCPFDYIFYKDIRQNCIRGNFAQNENIPVITGKTMVL